MKTKLMLICFIIYSIAYQTRGQGYTNALDESGYYLGLTDLKNLENNTFYEGDIQLCNDWFEENGLDELVEVKSFKVENNMLYIFIEAKDSLIDDRAFYGLWASIAKSYQIQYKEPIAMALFESFSFRMTTPRAYLSILVAKTKDSPVMHEMYYSDGGIEMNDSSLVEFGAESEMIRAKGVIDIPIIELSIKDLPEKETFKADDLRKITERIHAAFVDRFSKKKSYYLYFFTTSPIPESGLGDTDMYFHVYNLKNEVLKDGSWEYLRVKIELVQVQKNGENLLEVDYRLSGRYGSGIVNSPSDWKDYYAMKGTYDDEVERYGKYEIEPLIKEAITIRP
ncbi:MAG: hypothetical protein JKY03_10175 [Aureispira sp.]|nr:hypothetical protein [Aureispira sp.]